MSAVATKSKAKASPTDGFPVRMDGQQAASFLGVDTKTLDRWRTMGRLPKGAVIALPSGSARNLRPIYRYDRHKLQAFLDKCAQ